MYVICHLFLTSYPILLAYGDNDDDIIDLEDDIIDLEFFFYFQKASIYFTAENIFIFQKYIYCPSVMSLPLL